MLSREAFKLAGDPSKYPEQIKEGLRPWQPKKYYFNQGAPAGDQAPAAKILRLNLASYDPLLGKTYAEIGTEARSMHKCQGMAQLLALPGPSAATYQLVESTLPGQLQRDETTLFDGIDTSIPGLAQFAGPTTAAGSRRSAWREIDAAVKLAQTAIRRRDARTDRAAARGGPACRPRPARRASHHASRRRRAL